MKHFISCILLLFIALGGCKTSRPAAGNAAPVTPDVQQTAATQQNAEPAKFDYYEQTSWLLGFFDQGMMKREPHAAWFMKGYDEYVPTSAALNRLLEFPKDGLTMKIVMGSWCPDSRREVPRMMRILDLWQFPQSSVTFIGADVNKVSPIGDYEALLIERVPTFIVYKNNVEAGRIIEVPKTSLEQDIVNILQELKN